MKTQAFGIYTALCGEPFHMTHGQAAWLLKLFFNDMPGVEGVIWREAARDRKFWQPSAEIVAAMSMRRDWEMAANVILRECWPDYPKGIPQASFTAAKLACGIVSEAMEFDRLTKRRVLGKLEAIQRWERNQAEKMWDERMIASWLKVKGLRK